MEAKEFGEKMKRAVAEVLGEDYQVSLQEVKKNNGVVLQGLIFWQKVRMYPQRFI